MMLCIAIATVLALVAWSHEPVSIMSTWVSGLSSVVGLMLLAVHFARKYGLRKSDRL